MAATIALRSARGTNSRSRGARQESLVRAGGVGETVPGTDRQAIVAAIDAVADRFAVFQRNLAFMLDGEIGDAFARVELAAAIERLRRADIEAARAGAAV